MNKESETHECANCGKQIALNLEHCSHSCRLQRQLREATNHVIEFSNVLNNLTLFQCLRCKKVIGFKPNLDFNSYGYCSMECESKFDAGDYVESV